MSGFDIRAIMADYRAERITRREFEAAWCLWQRAGARW